MGLSLSVLVALFVLLPGAVFFFGLSRLHSPNAPSTQLDQYFSVALAIALVATGALHALWVAVATVVCVPLDAPTPAPMQLLGLLAGNLDSTLSKQAVESLTTYPWRVFAYFSTLVIASWLLGRMINPLLPGRRNASWYELLRPKGAMFVWLTADMHLNGQCYLFAGWVTEFCVSKTGALERVVLGYGVRRPLVPNPDEDDVKLDDGWVEVRGEAIVLQMAEARTINLDYFYPDNGDSGTEEETARQPPNNETGEGQ